jgi:hypothetical protein
LAGSLSGASDVKCRTGLYLLTLPGLRAGVSARSGDSSQLEAVDGLILGAGVQRPKLCFGSMPVAHAERLTRISLRAGAPGQPDRAVAILVEFLLVSLEKGFSMSVLILKKVAPQSGHVSNFFAPIGPMIEPIRAVRFQKNKAE